MECLSSFESTIDCTMIPRLIPGKRVNKYLGDSGVPESPLICIMVIPARRAMGIRPIFTHLKTLRFTYHNIQNRFGRYGFATTTTPCFGPDLIHECHPPRLPPTETMVILPKPFAPCGITTTAWITPRRTFTKGSLGSISFLTKSIRAMRTIPHQAALRLPSGDFDIPLLFQDKRFDCSGQLFMPPRNGEQSELTRLGVLGDRFTVNGIIQPKLTVLRRRYRFRFLNGGPSRFYQFFLTLDDNDQQYVHIGNDESLFENKLGCHERSIVASGTG